MTIEEEKNDRRGWPDWEEPIPNNKPTSWNFEIKEKGETAMTQADKANEGREEKIIFPVHPGDWPEDFDHENGNYIGLCRECGHSFRGHKRRFICKICMQPD